MPSFSMDPSQEPTPDPTIFPTVFSINSNANLSSIGMVETLAINIGAFILFMMIFESNRFYKQIYLKRLQNKFQVSFLFNRQHFVP